MFLFSDRIDRDVLDSTHDLVGVLYNGVDDFVVLDVLGAAHLEGSGSA